VDPQQTPAPHANRAAVWRRYLRFWGPRAEADVDDELRFHIEMRVRDYMVRGMSEDDARAAVARRLGDLARTRAECVTINTRRQRRMTRAQVIDALVQDARFALRTLGRQKAWTAVAILTLALGIGANTAVFSVVNSLVLHPLAYPHVDRVMMAMQEPTTGSQTRVRVMITPQPEVVRAWMAARSFEGIEPFLTTDVTLEQKGQAPSTVHAAKVLPTFPAFAGQRPLIGRMFTKQEADNKTPVALLSETMWRNRFGGATEVLGQVVAINEESYTIIGVVPRGLRLPRLTQSTTDVWLPLSLTQNAIGLSVVGRLRPGVDKAIAARDLDTLTARSTADKAAQGRFRARLVAPSEMVSFRESLVMLTVAVGLVLLIACANVAHLLLARGAARQRELAIRTALGAGKPRLFRQLITESLILGVAGCVGGMIVGWLGLHALVRIRPESLEELSAASVDSTALGMTVLLSAITAVGFGIFAAVQAARHSTHESLKAGSLTTSNARHHRRMRSVLVVTEMALSTTLLVGASLLVRSVVHLQTADPGFQPRDLYSVVPNLPETRYQNDTAKKAFYAQLVERARSIPGVDAVTIANGAPPGFNFLVGALQMEGEAPPPAGTTSFIKYNSVAPGFFRTMGMRLVEGAGFTDSTGSGGREIMVNEGFAKKHWPGRTGAGRKVRIVGYDGKGEWSRVVGVVADAATGGLTDQRSDPVLYVPGPDYYAPAVIVRTKPGVDALPALRSLVASLDPRLPPPTLTNIEQAMADSAERPRFTMMLLVTFTIVALVLAAVGLYGVMTYTVAQRTREIGIRIALGATRRRIARAVVSQGVLLAATGVLIGLAGAWWATKLLTKMLYGIAPTDPLSFSIGAALLLATAVLACVVPTRRAIRVDPVIAMRAE
jgi:putative ABC transport system permease protein